MTDDPSSPTAKVSSSTSPSRCPSCQYDLQGIAKLSRQTPCPECGYPAVLFSPPDQWLRHAGDPWLRRVSLGLRLMVISFWCLVALPCLLVVSVFVGVIQELIGMSPIYAGFVSEAFFVVLVLGGILLHATSSALISARPRQATPPDSKARLAVRVCGVAFAPVCAYSTTVLSFGSGGWPPWLVQPQRVVLFALSATYLFAMVRWLKHLEWRTEAWNPSKSNRYRRACQLITAMVGTGVLLYWLLDPLSGFLLPATEGESPDSNDWGVIFMLVAFGFVSMTVGRSASASVRHEMLQSEST